MGRFSQSVVDVDGDVTNWSIPTVDTPSTDATPYNALNAPYFDMANATRAIQRTNERKLEIMPTVIETSSARPTNLDAQNSNEWIVEYTVAGMNGPRYIRRVPGADFQLGVARNNRVELDIVSAGVGLTFKQVFEALYQHPEPYDNAGVPGAGTATVSVIYGART